MLCGTNAVRLSLRPPVRRGQGPLRRLQRAEDLVDCGVATAVSAARDGQAAS